MKLEKEVKSEIYKRLRSLESSGIVLWFERLNAGEVHNGNQHIYMCRPGTPDFVCVFVNRSGRLTVLFIEAKREGIHTTRPGVQREWEGLPLVGRHAK